jgi:hypothetical protein
MSVTIYRLHPMQEMRDHNYLLLTLSNIIHKLYPEATIVEDTNDKIEINIDGYNFWMYECELIIDFGDCIKAISFIDNTSNIVGLLHHRENDKDVFVYGQPNNSCIEPKPFKTIQGIYVKRWPYIDLDTFYELRKTKKYLIDKMIFRGNYGGLPRNSIYTLMTPEYSHVFEGANGKNPIPYFEELINYSVGLSIPGVGEYCYRDIEYMAVGIPMLRFEYESNLTPKLIPNVHYISIPRPDGMDYVKEREGSEVYAKMYVDRFLEVHQDQNFLEEIAMNAREYYDRYLHHNARVSHLLRLMEIYG